MCARYLIDGLTARYLLDNGLKKKRFDAIPGMFALLVPAPAIMLYSGIGKANEDIYANNFGNGL